MRPVILKTGKTFDELSARRGCYEHWFARALGWPLERFEVIDALAMGPLPAEADAVLVTGSPASVHEREPWSVAAGEWLQRVVRAGVPVLGVCYGHQLLGDVFGGQVGRNPNGREIGVVEVEADDDPLFEGLPRRFPVIQTHKDAVNTPPPGARVLARNTQTPVQALAFGDRVRTVQWHPEFDADIIRTYLTARAHLIDEESGPGTTERLLGEVTEVETGPIIMRNFARHFLGVPG